MSKRRRALVAIAELVIAAGVLLAASGVTIASPDEKRWQAVAPGRVESCSGQIKVATDVTAVVDKVLVKANDRVFAGEPLIHLADGEPAARLAAAETQVALRKRARDERSASGSANARRKARDAVADAEQALYDVRAIVDRAAAEWRTKGGPDDSLTTARSALARAQAELTKRQEELQTTEEDSPLPSLLEGQLSIARSEYAVARSALDKMTVRAPIDGTVLQVNVRAGELVSPGSPQPPLQLADLSALCLRAELDERDLGSVKVKQPVSVRAAAFPGREFEGIVSSIAPLVEPGRLEPSGSRNQTDVNIVEVMVKLTGPGELMVGMKADVFFRFGQVVDR
ncbi:efflux RND transporter periplasmic adaptor subunit [Bradyrhizobium sediminis]|uniref:Efflux RND transporter periplasmic adaptor subunit n=1 Tax=Bradyrhizobium sediminis TaxID=2840469 RepID=A0A975P1M5_9BRAD|nr:efflux RND transporter periplasmic adaptor subunit [Bradyrhizobium sediminis]QWG24504.1 efflux RND transporter periplasmic adaptor subunit [Bradyrhizobium sediminis]